MGNASPQVTRRGPFPSLYRDPQTQEFLIAGTGQQQSKSPSAA